MALDGTYSGLQASIADFLNRGDLTAAIPDFIVIAEAQMHRRFVGRQRQGLPIPRRLITRDAAFAVADAAEYIDVPSDFVGPLEFVLTTATPNPIFLDYLDEGNLQDWASAGGQTDLPPARYTVTGSQFRINPVADQAYTASLTYIQRLAALSASNEATNWILQDYPDAYLYGALTQSAPYLKDDARASTWGQLFTDALDGICNADPMPADMSTLRTEFPQLTRLGRYGYDVNTDQN
jgi:hypothetical protein